MDSVARMPDQPDSAPMADPIVLVAGAPFGGRPALGDWQLSRALARQRRVLYVDPPTPLHRRRRSREVATPPSGLQVLRPVGLPGLNRPVLRQLSNGLLQAQIAVALRRLPGLPGLPGGRRALITFDPRRGRLRGVRRSSTLYWVRDELHSRPNLGGSATSTRRLHERMLRYADVVTAVSPALVEAIRKRGAEAVLVPNGCDYEHFSRPRPAPAELPARRPLLGFVGGVNERVDLELLAALADRRPDWTILLLGELICTVPRRENLLALGPRRYDELPAWVQHFGVGLVPYRGSDFNRSSFPLKVFEYLAAGVPVVSTPLPSLRNLGPRVRTADDLPGWIGAVEAALANGPRGDGARELAAHNSWNDRAEAVLALLDAPQDQ